MFMVIAVMTSLRLLLLLLLPSPLAACTRTSFTLFAGHPIAFPKTSKNNSKSARIDEKQEDDGDLGLNNTRHRRGINCINYIQSCMLPSALRKSSPPIPAGWSIRKLYTTPEKVSMYSNFSPHRRRRQRRPPHSPPTTCTAATHR